tara:strand:- start:206 stop:469 length:264 start_codon:yes stop_codon:yes gene_type:complete
MEISMETYMWLIVLIIAAPVLYVLNDKYRILEGLNAPAEEETTFKAPSAQKLMKFTKKELVEFAENNNIVVQPSKTKAEIIKQIRKK